MQRLVRHLPTRLPVAFCLCLHVPATSRSALAEIVARVTELPVSVPGNGEPLRAGHLYVAPPDRHLLVHREHLELERGPKENRVRPAVDPLFRSASAAFGDRATAVVLSGALSDGANGAAVTAAAGGLVLVQDPSDAVVSGMPTATLAAVPGARALTAEHLAAAVATRATALPPLEPEDPVVVDTDSHTPVERSRHTPEGPPTGYTCPECKGPLWELDTGTPARFRCRVGHVYHEDHLEAAKDDEVESALWAALEALEEHAELMGRIGERLRGHGNANGAARYHNRQDTATRRAELVRGVLADRSAVPVRVAG